MPASITPVSKLSFRNRVAFCVSVISFLFLFPGIYLSMMSFSSEGSVKAKLSHEQPSFLGKLAVSSGVPEKRMSVHMLDTTRSILKTVHDLWNKNYLFVSCMIFLFSVIVPVLKGSLVTYLFFSNSAKHRRSIFNFVESIGKWSMCDVFIVATFLAYLSTGAGKSESAKNVTMMGYSVHVDVLTTMQAHLEIGFWCFLTYCLLSLIALQLYEHY